MEVIRLGNRVTSSDEMLCVQFHFSSHALVAFFSCQKMSFPSLGLTLFLNRAEVEDGAFRECLSSVHPVR